MKEVMSMVANLLITPVRTLGTVQALLLLCEWQVPQSGEWEGRGWLYCGVAIQYSLLLGLHRPHHSEDFTSDYKPRQGDRILPESIEGQERTLAWIYCHIIGYNVASIQGLPSPVKDDYVTLEACAASPGATPPWLGDIPKHALDALRLARFTDRVAQALGDSSLTTSGRLPGSSTTSLFSLFSSELTELERKIDTDDLNTSIRLHLCRIRLCAFELQTLRTPSNMTTRTIAAMDCYVGCMRLIGTTCTAPIDDVARWPVTVQFAYTMACICLIRLLSTEEGLALDMNAALTQISTVFRMSSQIISKEDELRRSANMLIHFCVCNATHGKGNKFEDLFPDAQSRMGMCNWLRDCIVRGKHMRSIVLAARQAGQTVDYQDAPAQPLNIPVSGAPDLLAEPPAMDYTMLDLTPVDFDEILASFSNGEWEMPPADFYPTR
ncbi:hypothetical protein HWV62_34645 [Athelia sp. TMB]|nr:hypothetical protein HWV62_34645 [Athelia sp. TMB]